MTTFQFPIISGNPFSIQDPFKTSPPKNPSLTPLSPSTIENRIEPVELEDLVYSYPDVHNRNIQRIFTSKKEFQELSASLTQESVNRGEFLKHQLLTKRMLYAIDHLLIMSRTGTGKTGAVIAPSESYKKAVLSAIIEYSQTHADSAGNSLTKKKSYQELLQKGIFDHASSYLKGETISITKVYYLVKNKLLIDEISREITEVLTVEDEYHTKHVRESKSKHIEELRLKAELGKFYQIMTYTSFVKEVLGIDPKKKIERTDFDLNRISDEYIKGKYSGCMFIVDEVDSLRFEGEDISIELETEKSKIRQRSEETYRSLEFAYKLIHRIFHTALRTKQVLMTATPMADKPNEIAYVMNLILPMNNQIKFNPDEYKHLTYEQMEPFFRGRVSYVREPDGQVDVFYNGAPLNKKVQGHDSQTKTVRLPMYNYVGAYQNPITKENIPIIGQDNVYNNILNSSSNRQTNAFKVRMREISNFTFPDGSVGKGSFKKYIRQAVGRKHDYEAYNGLDVILSDSTPDKVWISTLSHKFSYIFNEVDRSWNTNSLGSSYIFSPLVKNGSIPLSLVFKYQGYQNFLETESIFQRDREGKPIIINGMRSIKPEFQAGIKRYALITADTPKTIRTAILEAFNSPENVYGKIIKVIILSPFGKVGINLKNVSQIFLLSPWWNRTFDYQAISRAIRVLGHIDILNILRSYNKERFIVNVYMLESSRFNGEDAIDNQLYLISEEKDRNIKRFERFMRRSALDCHIHRQLNQRLDDQGISTDKDGSAICDYQSCTYECFKSDPDEIDYTSYDVIYSSEIVEQIIDKIRFFFRKESSYSLNNFYKLFLKHDGKLQYNLKHIVTAISKIINERIIIRDAAGFSKYLFQDGDFLYLRTEYPTNIIPKKGVFSMSIYDEGFMGSMGINLKKYISNIQLPTQQKIIEQILYTVNSPDEVQKLLNSLNNEGLANLIEFLIIEDIKGNVKNNLKYEWILGQYKNNIFKFGNSEVISQELDLKVMEYRQTLGKQGLVNINRYILIYAHIIYGIRHGETEHGKNAQKFQPVDRIRILRQNYTPSNLVQWDTEWRDADEIELKVFNDEIINTKKEEYAEIKEQKPLYGILERSTNKIKLAGNFRQLKTKLKNTKEEIKGRVCTSINVPELIPISVYLGLRPKTRPYIDPNTPINYMINYIENSPRMRDDYKILFAYFDKESNKEQVAPYYYEWILARQAKSGKNFETVPEFCVNIQREMGNKDLIKYE